jgi:AAA domain-containing protein
VQDVRVLVVVVADVVGRLVRPTPGGGRVAKEVANAVATLEKDLHTAVSASALKGFLDGRRLDYNPTLIVLDSLTRIHTQDENAVGAMSALYNDGIKPLARETGAAVVLIHHTNKGQRSSYTRARGSSDIVYAMDGGIDARQVEPCTEHFIKLSRVHTGSGIE